MGAEPALELMERGVVAVEHLCKPALFSVGRQGAWIESFEEACARIPEVAGHGGGAQRVGRAHEVGRGHGRGPGAAA